MSFQTHVVSSPSSFSNYETLRKFYVNSLLRLVENQSIGLDEAAVLSRAIVLWDDIHTQGFHELVRRYQSGTYRARRQLFDSLASE